MVHLENFNIELVIERLRHALDQRGKQVDAHAHVAGLDDDRALCRLRDQLLVFTAEAGGADDVDEPCPCRVLGERDGRRRHGEIKKPVGLRKQRVDIGADLDLIGAEPGQLAGIAADHGGAGSFHGAG